MKTHLAKHNVFEKSNPEDLGEGSSVTKQYSIASMFRFRAERDINALLQYPSKPSLEQPMSKLNQDNKRQSLEARVLQKLQPQVIQRSDIDRYFGRYRACNKKRDWLFARRMHKDEYPRMVAAARDYLAIPAAEVALERLFSRGRDLVGLCRHSLKGETMRKVMLLRDIYSSESTQ
jgi:hypothetical protein